MFFIVLALFYSTLGLKSTVKRLQSALSADFSALRIFERVHVGWTV